MEAYSIYTLKHWRGELALITCDAAILRERLDAMGVTKMRNYRLSIEIMHGSSKCHENTDAVSWWRTSGMKR